jgi:hypothetical protein
LKHRHDEPQIITNNNNNQYDINSNLSSYNQENNQASNIKNNQYLRVSLLKKNELSSSCSTSSQDSSSITSTPDTSPFIIRKQQQPNSELLNKMLEIAFNKQNKTVVNGSGNTKKNCMKEYRDLNTMVPDSL